MKNYLEIINITGTRGSGATTQCHLLENYLTTLGANSEVLEDPVYDLGILEMVKPGKLLINNGSIARMLGEELAKGKNRQDIVNSSDLVRQQAEIHTKAQVLNIILVMDNLQAAQERLDTRQELVNEELETINTDQEYIVNDFFRGLDKLTVTGGMKFHFIEISDSENMLEVHKRILALINEHFLIKKPL